VDKAVERCISEGILKDYLLKKRAEAVSMFLTEFDEKAWEKTIREEEQENTERERQRAEMESRKAEMERQNAEMERQRAERAEARIAELEEQLNAKKVGFQKADYTKNLQ